MLHMFDCTTRMVGASRNMVQIIGKVGTRVKYSLRRDCVAQNCGLLKRRLRIDTIDVVVDALESVFLGSSRLAWII